MNGAQQTDAEHLADPHPARAGGLENAGHEPMIPHPPIFVRSAGFWALPTGIAKLRGTVSLSWDVRAETLCLAGKIRVFPLIPWRMAVFVGVVALASVVGGFVIGPWIAQSSAASLATPAPSLSDTNVYLVGLYTAIGAFAAMLPTWFVAWLLMTIDLPRVDVPALALRGASLDGRNLVLHVAPQTRWHLNVLTEQERSCAQLVDILNRVAGVVEDVQREMAATGEWVSKPAAKPATEPPD